MYRNSSDNSYDVLECENENNDRSIVEDLSNNVIDSSEDEDYQSEKEDHLKKLLVVVMYNQEIEFHAVVL